jgi:IS5 family transposase
VSARARYEFGCKVSVVTTLDEGIVVGLRSFAGKPYDGHMLKEALEQVENLSDQRLDLSVVDRGYRRHGVEATRVLLSGIRRGLTPKLIADLGHLGRDRSLENRWPPEGYHRRRGLSAMNACGHNIRKILAHLRAWLAWIIAVLWVPEIPVSQPYLTAPAT